jgi:cephalosporin-C deacetylase
MMALFDLPLDELARYAPAVAEPADFDAFWRATLADAAASPVLVDVRPVATDLRLVDTWDVTFAGYGGHPVRACFTRPAGDPAELLR